LSEGIRRIWLATGQPEDTLARLQKAGGTSLPGLATITADPSLDFEVRSSAVWVLGRVMKLGRHKKSDALAPLLAALGDPNKWLRGAAAQALGVLHDRRARSRLIEVMRTDPEIHVRTFAAHALGDLNGPRAIEALRQVLGNQDEDPNVRGMAAESLAYCFAREAVRDLIAGLHDRTPEVRFWSAFALGFMKAKPALLELERLASRDGAEVPGWWSVSKEAAWAIAEIKAPADDQTRE
jgi:HEAT repeat protein